MVSRKELPISERPARDPEEQDLEGIARRLLTFCKGESGGRPDDPTLIPNQRAVVRIIEQARRLFFPGYFAEMKQDSVSSEYSLGVELKCLYEALSKEICLAPGHDDGRSSNPGARRAERSCRAALKLIEALPELREILATDIRAALDGDPAAKSADEVILSYPGLFAIAVYRIAHKLHELGVSLLPRMMTEYVHSLTGIDIHPGAKIGESFFIDHGTGVVVGETTAIGNRVRLYQGVTLGALSLPRDATSRYRNTKRHPTVEDDVIIYSNATILGAKAIIGARSIIGGNVWITDRVPPDTKVILKRPELVYIGKKSSLGFAAAPTEGKTQI
jgi:serine O-acetyltransferase